MADELFRQNERLTAAKLNRLLTGTRSTSVVSDELDGFSDAPGTILVRETDGWEALGPGTDGQVLTIGADSIPAWEDLPAGNEGSVTSVDASGGTTGLSFSGGPITSSGTLALGGTLAIASGGTGATTAGGALTNLGVSAFAQTVLDDTTAAAARTTLGAAAATDATALLDETRQFTVSFAGTDAETVPIPLAFDIIIPAGTYSEAIRGTANATGSTAYTVKKNGTTIGTATVGASALRGDLVVGSAVTISGAGVDDLDCVGPTTADATLVGVSLTVPYRRVR